ncbi:thioredoxin domain-containing protein [Sphingomonas sp. HITSZ_GF]|uniref:DsbA family protein n=1 Tax=Sphingomonas sp. HITSZ_GF TaxID=3037247 RepID=UPI00240DCD69|nr:thioredoxin domain-containing protein [Sphingomonas sp. HITSZ_GF]MDG2533357.1 thioredoxin domain-containing protein [Sphingomonas sp. HITSZ_GF]
MRTLFALAGAAALALIGGASAQQAAKPAPNWESTVTVTPQGGYRQGNPDAPVKLVEYGSRGCPTCGRFAAEGVPALRRDYVATGKVSYEFRDYLIHGPPDLAMAALNQCVPTARFFPVLDALFANQRQFEDRLEALVKSQPAQVNAWQKLPMPQMATRFAEAMGLIAFMKTQGLPEAKARQCLADPKLIARIAKTNADAVTIYKVDSTPTFIVNARKVSAYSWERLLPELWANGASD